MSTRDMQERVAEAREERDRLIKEYEEKIAGVHKSFAVMLETEKEQFEVDENGKNKRVYGIESIAKAAGYSRVHLYAYIEKWLRPKPKKT